MTEVNYNAQNQSLEITHRIFWDDLERLFKSKYDPKLRLGQGAETPNVEQYLADYLQKNFRLEINNKNLKINYLGKEYDQEVLLVYMEILKVKKLNSAKIHHTVMHSLFDDQRNITNFVIGKEKMGALTTPSEPTAQLSF